MKQTMKLMDLFEDYRKMKIFIVFEKDNKTRSIFKDNSLTKEFRALDSKDLNELTESELERLKEFYEVDTDEERRTYMLENIQAEQEKRK